MGRSFQTEGTARPRQGAGKEITVFRKLVAKSLQSPWTAAR